MAESARASHRSTPAADARAAPSGAELDAKAVALLSGAVRLVSIDAQSSVERFSDPQLLAAGKVNLISLEAIQQRFGEHWQSRKEKVFAFAEEVLRQEVGPRGIHLRISDTDFFIIHRELGRLAGQAACLRYLRAILTHCLGEGAAASAGVLQVTRITKGRIEVGAIDALRAEAAIAGPGDEADEAGTSFYIDAEGAGRPGAMDPWAPFVAGDGRTLRVSATLEPVYELKGYTRIGFRMIRRVIVVATGEELSAQQISQLSSGDLLRVDLATITRGVDRLTTEGDGKQQLSLIVPFSYASLSSPRGRIELIDPLRAAGAHVKLGVICEIFDIEGVPQGALMAATALVRPYSLLVVGRLASASPAAIGRFSGVGLQALSFECPQGLGDGEFIGWATAAVTAAKRVAKSVMVYRARSPRRVGSLASLGATHASMIDG